MVAILKNKCPCSEMHLELFMDERHSVEDLLRIPLAKIKKVQGKGRRQTIWDSQILIHAIGLYKYKDLL